MIEHYEKFVLHDKNGNNDIEADVNWRPDDEDLNKCQIVRFKLGKKTAYISKDELNALIFIIGSRNEQRKMIPQKLTKVRHYNTFVNIMATRDVKRGEIIRGPVTITIPAVSEEIIGEIAKQAKSSNDVHRMIDDLERKAKVDEDKQAKVTYINETEPGVKKTKDNQDDSKKST